MYFYTFFTAFILFSFSELSLLMHEFYQQKYLLLVTSNMDPFNVTHFSARGLQYYV